MFPTGFPHVIVSGDFMARVEDPEMLSSMLIALNQGTKHPFFKDSVQVFLNVSGTQEGVAKLLNLKPKVYNELVVQRTCNIVETAVKLVLGEDGHLNEMAAMILTNLTKRGMNVDRALIMLESCTSTSDYSDIIARLLFNLKERNDRAVNALAPFVYNATRSEIMRKIILDQETNYISHFIINLSYPGTTNTRISMAGIVRNCCLELYAHQWLASAFVDILPSLLWPLMGNEEYSPEVLERLPPSVRDRPKSKTREEECEIRWLLVDTMTLLCRTETVRMGFRVKAVRNVLRALENWEPSPRILQVCVNLITTLERPDDPVVASYLGLTTEP